MGKWKMVTAVCLAGVVAVVGYAAVSGTVALAAETRECGDNAIIRCGSMTAGELQQDYADNDRGVKAIFSYYNIVAADIAKSENAKVGYVHTNGTVTVDGKTVATDAVTLGRSSELGGAKVNANGWTVYQGPDRLKSTLSAFVFFNSDGTFKSAVLRVCGNPVKAKPVEKPKAAPVYTCDSLTATKISRTEYAFVAAATAKNGATIVDYSYSFGDGSTATNGASINHTYANAGTYVAVVSVNVRVGTETKTVTDGNCKVNVSVAPAPIQVCNTATDTIITIEEKDFDAAKHTRDLTQCEKTTVCDTITKKVIIIHKNDMKDTYTTDFSKCDTKVCRISDKAIITVRDDEYQNNKDKYTTDMSKCKETPAPAPTLPQTGATELLSGGVGAGALTLAGYYYAVSRRLV